MAPSPRMGYLVPTMEHMQRLLENNRRWAAEMTASDPQFFTSRAGEQAPHFLFVGCSDSRVPAEVLTGSLPGEMFVHRNVANQVLPADLNALSVLQFAVEILKVGHVIVCGHYGCGGIRAAMGSEPLGLVDHWLANVRSIMRLRKAELDLVDDPDARCRRLVDLNVIEQIYNLARTPVVQSAWQRGRTPALHGLVYDLHSGVLHPLALAIDSQAGAEALAHTSSSSQL